MLQHLNQAELSETIRRAQAIAEQGRELSAPEGQYGDYLQAAEEMGVPREAMLQALRERMLIPSETLEVGQQVFAPSADGFWYVATLLSVSEHTARVRFLEGGEHTCAATDLRPLSLIPGRKLQGDIKDWGWWACIALRHDPQKERVQVMHDDWAGGKEWLPLRKLRLTREHVHPKREGEQRSETAVKNTLLRVAALAGSAGLALGLLLDRLLPFVFPFLR